MTELFERFSEAEVFDELLVIVHTQLAKRPLATSFEWEPIINGLVDRVGRQGWTRFQEDHYNLLRRNESVTAASYDCSKVVAAMWRFVNRGWA